MKLARKIGEDLGLKTNPLKVAKRLGLPPGMHGKKNKRKMSDYGVQLKEKQKLRFMYGLTEKQLRKAYDVATKTPTATGAALLKLLERRLDNVIYRMKFAPTRAAARQLVNHGHVVVNGKKMDVSSYIVEVEDHIQLKDSATKIPAVADSMKDNVGPVEWMEVKGTVGKVVRFANRDEIDSGINEQLIVEWYSR
jgi:small subunit ribosomal protein S4